MIPNRCLRIATNFTRVREACGDIALIEQVDLQGYRSWSDLRRLLWGPDRADAIIVNIDSQLTFRLCLLKWLVPLPAAPVISVDIIVSRPQGLAQRCAAFIKKLLLRKVSLFILYFKDLVAYDRYYGIGPSRSAYVPFKSNSWELLRPEDTTNNDGQYVLAAGRTKRDIQTYFAAMQLTGLPAVLLHEDDARMAKHGTTFDASNRPSNLKLVKHDGGRRSWIEHLRNARVIVVPILGSTISSSGIGTYIDAMAMRKAVVITDGPATRGIITDQAMVIPIADAHAMAAVVTALWHNDSLRHSLSNRARAYAEQLKGEDRLLNDVLKVAIERCIAQ
ncbi:MAG: glycosyltransferase [Steroidobacteraceae bacterium]